MWRLLRWTGRVVAAVLLLLAALLWTQPGHDVLAWSIGKATDGEVVITGLSGALPGHVRAQSVELRDAGGAWLRIQDASLDWSVLPALRNHFVLQHVGATRLDLLRRPLPKPSSGGETPHIDIDEVSLPQIDIAPSVIGYPAMLAARGAVHFTSRHQLEADLAITRPGGSDHYTIKGGIADDVIHGSAEIQESPDGLFGRIAGLPGLGAIALSAQASGDKIANRMAFALTAGVLRANGKGMISLADTRADIDFTLQSPAMMLHDDLGWASLTADGHMHGGFEAPNVEMKFHMARLLASGVRIAAVDAHANGQAGGIDMTGTATGLRLPGAYAGLFASNPIQVKIHLGLSDATRPVTFSIDHPLMALNGKAHTAGTQTLTAQVNVPSLAPFAALVKQDLRGAAQLRIDSRKRGDRIALDLSGGIQAQGQSVVAQMLGAKATLAFHALVSGADVTQTISRLHGAGFEASVTGGFTGGRMDYRVSTALLDLSRLTPTLNGTMHLAGAVTGEPAKALVDMAGDADMASRGFARQQMTIRLTATDLPNPATARLTANGKLDGAALALAANWSQSKSGHDAKLALDWKSLAARADIGVPEKGGLTGHVALDAKNIGDLDSFIGMRLAGALHATGDLAAPGGHQSAQLHVAGNGLKLADNILNGLRLNGSITDLFGTAHVDVKLDASGLTAEGISGAASAQINGPADKLSVAMIADLKDSTGQPVHLAANAVADVAKRHVALGMLTASGRGQTARLSAPATFDLADGVGVDRLTVKVAGGSVTMAGRVLPVLAMTASADNIELAALQSFIPQLRTDGVLSADAQLHGTLAAPSGVVALHGRDIRVRDYSRRLAPATLDVTAQLNGTSALLDAKLADGASGTMTAHGTVPLGSGTLLDLHVAGSADLAMLDPLLAVDGRQVKGMLSLEGSVAGTVSAPRLSGSAALKDGEAQDYAQGLRLHDVSADVKANNNVVQIVSFKAQAGPGTITGNGTVNVAATGWPISLTVSANNARPIVSDVMTASLSGDLVLAGKLKGAMTLSGKLRVPRAELTLPDSFPPEVRSLNIRRRGEPPPAPAPAITAVALDLSVTTTGPVTVRGHGIDADLDGNLHISASTGAPLVSGGFEMARGTLSVAGQTLNFSTGKVSFDGTGVRGRLDPTLNFVAQAISGGVTANLTVAGYASAPKIVLTSTPQLPQDEVLAHLLFQQSSTQLSPLQLAEIAQALASLSGIGAGFNPVASLRGGLGLDRLSVGSGGNGVANGTTVAAGKYVAHNVYVGAKQGLSGGTQAQVQVDITHNLKAEATISTGANATATQGSTAAQDTGSNLGLSYQFEY